MDYQLQYRYHKHSLPANKNPRRLRNLRQQHNNYSLQMSQRCIGKPVYNTKNLISIFHYRNPHLHHTQCNYLPHPSKHPFSENPLLLLLQQLFHKLDHLEGYDFHSHSSGRKDLQKQRSTEKSHRTNLGLESVLELCEELQFLSELDEENQRSDLYKVQHLSLLPHNPRSQNRLSKNLLDIPKMQTNKVHRSSFLPDKSHSNDTNSWQRRRRQKSKHSNKHRDYHQSCDNCL